MAQKAAHMPAAWRHHQPEGRQLPVGEARRGAQSALCKKPKKLHDAAPHSHLQRLGVLLFIVQMMLLLFVTVPL